MRIIFLAMSQLKPIKQSLVPQGFFLGGTGVPPGSKNFALPHIDCHPSFFDQSLFPQLSFVPENFKNVTSFFFQF